MTVLHGVEQLERVLEHVLHGVEQLEHVLHGVEQLERVLEHVLHGVEQLEQLERVLQLRAVDVLLRQAQNSELRRDRRIDVFV